MSPARAALKVSYRWHLRVRMAEQGMFQTSELVPLLAERGVVLSREQVYRLVAKVPERLNLNVLAALCDILGCGPTELVEPVRAEAKAARAKVASPRSVASVVKPRRARVAPGTER
jgi:DNA-binding Xre family transcriptional regulator